MPLTANEQMLLTIASNLPAQLKDHVVFLGGSVVSLLITDEAFGGIRTTRDVDLIVDVAGRLRFNNIEKPLRIGLDGEVIQSSINVIEVFVLHSLFFVDKNNMETENISRFLHKSISTLFILLFCVVFSGFKGIAKAYLRVNAVESLSSKSFEKKNDNGQNRIRELKKNARLGNPESNFELGLLYYKGEDVPEDLFLASAYFEKAEKLGHQDSLKMLKQINEYWANSEASANNEEVSSTDLIIEQLKDSSKLLNLQFPQKIDSETIVERTEVGPGASITYFYTLINYPSTNISAAKLRRIVLPSLLENVKNEKPLLEALANGVVFRHCYMGNDGKTVLDIPITYSTYTSHSKTNIIAKN